MSFNSMEFLLFFPVVVLIYFIIPHKVRWVWLLLASYYFYMSWNPKYALLMGTSTVITYLCGILIGRTQQKKSKNQIFMKKLWVVLSLVLNLAILFFFKYFYFAVSSINSIFSYLNLAPVQVSFDVILPVGISFYTFQALGYTLDVYRGEIKPEKNLGRYALFVSFFPQLVAGPIERSKNLLHQLREKHTFDLDRVKDGLLLMLWGFFLKIVIADRAAILVDQVYNHYEEYGAVALILATVLFAVQIYCDFSSYSNIAIGAARVMGFHLMTNFEEPYLASSVAGFWRRWHISLSTWFRDYVYIPLGGNRVKKGRWAFNVMVVFLLSGLWHGAGWTFVIWGGLHGAYQIIGGYLRPWKQKIWKAMHVNADAASFRIGQILVTFLLVDFGWIFFRSNSLDQAKTIIRKMFVEFEWPQLSLNYLTTLGLDYQQLMILLGAVLVLAVVSLCHYRGIHIRPLIERQQLWFRWSCYLSLLFAVLSFGILGVRYTTSPFLYFQF